MLYPIKFIPIFKEKVWGGKKLKTILNKNILSNKTGESWEISVVPDNISIVKNGELKGYNLQEIIQKYKTDFLGNSVYEKFGNNFPLLIKFIDASDDLSVQVHPDDNFAQKQHGENGKNEMWYIIDAEDNTDIVVGVNKNISKNRYISLVNEAKTKEFLNLEKINKDDAFYIPAGRIHAIMKGTLLAEIQQNSDLTYRIFDWNRKGLDGKLRELHTDLASKVVELEKKDNYFIEYHKNKNSCLVSNKYFNVNVLNFKDRVLKDYTNIDSFVIYMCVEGSLTLKYKNINYKLAKGETLFLPAIINELEIFPQEESKILEIYL